jgi:hypothetical protein
MSETLSETAACGLLARLFRARGYTIARNVMFREYGVSFHVDGWDAAKRVGFEFLTSEDDDHDDLTLSEYQTLMVAQQRGELAIFVIDEVEPLSAADLAETVNAFLDEAEAAAAAPRRRTKAAKGRKPAAARKKPTQRRVSTQKKARKAARRTR